MQNYFFAKNNRVMKRMLVSCKSSQHYFSLKHIQTSSILRQAPVYAYPGVQLGKLRRAQRDDWGVKIRV